VGENRGEPDGVVVALCTGHRCAALTRMHGGSEVAAAVARSSGGVLVSAPCLQRCADGAVGAVALRVGAADVTGPSLWLGGLEANDRLTILARWVENWSAGDDADHALPAVLHDAVLGRGSAVRLPTTGAR
jgi:hypothetical protein